MCETGMEPLFEAAKDAAVAAMKPTELKDGASFVAVPQSYRIHTFGEPYPGNVNEHLVFSDAESFSLYVNDYKGMDGTPLLTASIADDSKIARCILDYHTWDGATREGAPRKCQHKVDYVPMASEQYSRWRKIDGVTMSQAAFSEFIEEFCNDIVSPAPATMMEIAGDLSMSAGLEFKSRTNTQNGMVALQYIESGKATTKDGGEVPKTFRLKIPVFFGEEPVEIEVFLRFSVAKGEGLRFAVKLRDRDTLEKERFLAAVNRIAEMTELTPLIGHVSA